MIIFLLQVCIQNLTPLIGVKFLNNKELACLCVLFPKVAIRFS